MLECFPIPATDLVHTRRVVLFMRGVLTFRFADGYLGSYRYLAYVQCWECLLVE